jgi:membrane protein
MTTSTTGSALPPRAALADRGPRRVRLFELARRVWNEMDRDHVAIVAAGVAFFGMLSVFPALIALVAIYGLVFDPVDVERQAAALAGAIPGPVNDILAERLTALASTPPSRLSIGLVISFVVTLITASSGTNVLIEAVNVAFDERETRGFFKQRLFGLLMALAIISFLLVTVAVVAFLPPVLDLIGFGGIGRDLVSILRWPVLAVCVLLGLSALYQYAPKTRRTPHRWISAGAVVATAVWVVASLGFSLYVSSFGRYDEVYGGLGGAVVLMLWMYVSATCVLLGAEIDSELERARFGPALAALRPLRKSSSA